MNNPKQQHYIPQMLLKHFVDDMDQLWLFEQNVPNKRVEKRNIKSIFRKRNVYTFTNPDGSRDYSTEFFLSKLESAADPVVCKIFEHARNGKPPSLTLAEREAGPLHSLSAQSALKVSIGGSKLTGTSWPMAQVRPKLLHVAVLSLSMVAASSASVLLPTRNDSQFCMLFEMALLNLMTNRLSDLRIASWTI